MYLYYFCKRKYIVYFVLLGFLVSIERKNYQLFIVESDTTLKFLLGFENDDVSW